MKKADLPFAAMVRESFHVQGRGTVLVIQPDFDGTIRTHDQIRVELKGGERKVLEVRGVDFLDDIQNRTAHIGLTVHGIDKADVVIGSTITAESAGEDPPPADKI